MKKIILFIVFIIINLISGVLYAQPLHLNTLNPVRNALNIPNNFTIQTAFSANIPTPDNTKIKVMGSQTGFYTAGSFTGAGTNFITFDPTLNFKAGETVTVEFLTTLLGAGGETFTSAHQYQFTAAATGTGNFIENIITPTNSLRRIRLADMDKDTDLDVVVSNATTDRVEVWLNSGKGAYILLGSYGAGFINGINKHFIADLDSDGDLDVAVANYTGQNLTILLNNGTGALISSVVNYSISVPTSLDGCVGGDFDADGDIDLAVSETGNDRIGIFLNNGSGFFSYYANFTIPSPGNGNPIDLFAADLDNDGDLDIVSGNNDGNNHDCGIFLNNGNANFAVSTLTVPISQTLGAIAGVDGKDLDNDGLIDLVVTVVTNGSRDIRFFKNNGVTFVSQGAADVVLPTGDPFDVRLGDMDGDGNIDVVASSNSENKIYYLRNDGGFTFTQTLLNASSAPIFLDLGDVDGDQDLDILMSGTGFTLFRNALPYHITNLNPIRNALNFATAGNIVTTFTTAMTTPFATVEFKVMGSQTGFYTAGTFGGNGTPTITFDPTQHFKAGETLTVEFLTTLQSANGSVLITTHQYQFTAAATGTGQGVFIKPNADIAVGLNPRSVYPYDADGDGDMDLAVANYDANTVSILKNNGTGIYSAPQDFSVGNKPIFVCAFDADSDGDMDLAVVNLFSTNLSVLKNDGTGFYITSGTFPLVNAPHSAYPFDADGDGDMDLAVPNYNSNDVSVLKNDGTGTYGTAINFAVGNGPTSAHAFDADGDGDMDLAVGNISTGNVSVLKNDGTGFYAAAVNLPVGTGTRSVYAFDADGDGDMDLAAANYGSNNVSVLKNDGTGSYAAATNFSVGTNPFFVYAFDADADGDMDLAVANEGSNNVSVLKNDGTGFYTAAANFVVGTEANSVYAFDADSDGDMDLAVANRASNNVSVLFNQPRYDITTLNPVRNALNFATAGNIVTTFNENMSTPFATAQFKVMGSQTGFYTAGTFGGNGTPTVTFDPAQNFKAGETITVEYLMSLLATNGKSFLTAHQYQFTAAATGGAGNIFANRTDYATGNTPMYPHAFDADGDGDIDLVCGNTTTNTFSILKNNGNGIFAPKVDYLAFNTAGNTQRLQAFDADGDGDIDIASTNNLTNTFSIVKNNGNGTYATPVDYPTGQLFGVSSINFFDADGDGDIDLVAGTGSGATDTKLCYFPNNGNGTYGTGVAYAVTGITAAPSSRIMTLLVFDADGDGDMDVACLKGQPKREIDIFKNNGSGIFSLFSTFDAGGNQPIFACSFDADGDGDIDLAVGNNVSANIVIFKNNGTGNFVLGQNNTGVGGPVGLSAFDMDGDGDMDLASSSWTEMKFSIYRNNGTGTFDPKVDYTVGNAPYGTCAFDADGDGDIDLAVTNRDDNDISILFNKPRYDIITLNPIRNALNFSTAGNIVTSFTTVMTTPFATENYKVMGSQTGFYTAGTFSGNGTPTVTFDPTQNFKAGETLTVEFLTSLFSSNGSAFISSHQYQFTAKALGNGDFVSVNTYNTQVLPSQVATGDIDRDGLVDIAVTNNTSGTVSVFRNTGGGNLAFVNNFSVAALPRGIVLADLDNDGDLDIGTANNNATSTQQLSILINNGAWSFALTNYAAGGATASDPIATADMNGDGYLDIVMHNSNQIRVMRNQGNGTFAVAVSLTAVGVENRGLHLADLDNDGDMDIAVANGSNNSISIFRNLGNFTFDTRIDRPTTGAAFGILTSDFNADGFQDIATCNTSPTNQIAIFINSGGSFTTATYYGGFTNPASLSVSDFDGDNDLDISVSNNSGATISILTNNGAGSFSAPLVQILTGTSPNALAHADFDNDQDMDMVVVNSSTNKISLLLNSISFVVTNTNDSGVGSLRQAIINANSTLGFQSITFNIPSPSFTTSYGNVYEINLITALPAITQTVSIDASTQPNFNNFGNVRINGQNSISYGLQITSPFVSVYGMEITGFTTAAGGLGYGVWVNGDAADYFMFGTVGKGNVVNGNYEGIYANNADFGQYYANRIGTDPTGAFGKGNFDDGMVFINSATDNQIGFTTASGGNLISGNTLNGIRIEQNSHRNIIRGNFIGTNQLGTAAINNNNDGVALYVDVDFTTIGGVGFGNVISGNRSRGILIFNNANADFTNIKGNLIGTNLAGTAAIPNGTNCCGSGGVIMYANTHTNTEIGGALAGEGNLISGNTRYAISTRGNLITIKGNKIGTTYNGMTALPNGTVGMVAVELVGTNITFGGATWQEGNLVSGNSGVGVTASGTNVNFSANIIGLNATQTAPLTNGANYSNESGILVSGTNVTIGFLTGNVIAGNTANSSVGIRVQANNVTIQNNSIGTNSSGLPFANNRGIVFVSGSFSTVQNNTIAHNTNEGVLFQDASSQNNKLSQNRIFCNGITSKSINLNGVANANKQPPVILNAIPTQVSGTSLANDFVEVFFHTGSCFATVQASTFLTVVQANALGNWSFTTATGLLNLGDQITSTATDLANNTSEFSAFTTISDPFVVVNTNDSGVGSLRQAIINANSTLGFQSITFNIPTASFTTSYGNVYEINLITALPAITQTVSIDASTQPNFTNFGNVRINGQNSISYGLQITAPFVSVYGMEITGFTTAAGGLGYGVWVNGDAADYFMFGTVGKGNVVNGNYEGIYANNADFGQYYDNKIGTDPTGTFGKGNFDDGMVFINSATDNQIGFTTAQGGNLISGNTLNGINFETSSHRNSVRGNFIGTNQAGTAEISNGRGVRLDNNINFTTIGGINFGNLISGNNAYAILIMNGANADYTTIKGNLIGTNLVGTTAIPNKQPSFGAITIWNGGHDNIQIGGALVGEGNLISGNTASGILQEGSNQLDIRGNKIGTTHDGMGLLGNGGDGISIYASPNTSFVTIGGATWQEGNLISGNNLSGVGVSATSTQKVVISANIIGLNATQTAALSNAQTGTNRAGIIANNNVTIGFLTGNVIAGNTANASVGVRVNANNVTIQNNSIGTNSSGLPFANNRGIVFVSGSFSTVQNNTIAHNTNEGVLFQDASSQNNKLSQNRIFCNGATSKSINLNGVANANKQPPVILNATPMQVSGTSLANDFVEVFFHTGSCFATVQASTFLTVVQANALGNWSFTTANGFLNLGDQITSTATDLANNTSEFSAFTTISDPFVVVNTNDSGVGSLRQAIINANANPDFTTITFNIPTADPNFISASYWRIRPVSPLPSITQALWIAGHSQTGASPNSNPFGQAWNGNLKIQIDGNNSLPFLLNIGTNNVIIRGLNLVGSAQSAINIGFGNQFVTVTGCLIGTNIDGTATQGNIVGVDVQGNNNLIGGSHESVRNLISGNTIGVRITGTDNHILYNYIGHDRTGSTALPNQTGIEAISANGTQIINNGISGNLANGIKVTGGNTTITNNKIGLAAGSLPLGNANGIQMLDANGIISSNIIAFNSVAGAFISSSNVRTVKFFQNSFYNNGSIGIDLVGNASQAGITPNDPRDFDIGVINGMMNYPEFATGSVAATLNDKLVVSYLVPSANSVVNYPLTVEFFLSDGNRQGKTLVHTDTYGALQAENFVTIAFTPFVSINIGNRLVATATDANGNTSEFSAELPIDIPCPIRPEITAFKTVDTRTCATARTFAVLTVSGGIQGNYNIDWQNDGNFDAFNITLNDNNELITELGRGTLVSNIRIINFARPLCPSTPYFTTTGLIDPKLSDPPSLNFISIVDPTNCDSSNGQVAIRVGNNIPANASFDVDLNGDGDFDFVSVRPSANKELIFKDLKAGFKINFIRVRLHQIQNCQVSSAVLNRTLAFSSIGNFDLPVSAEKTSLDFEGSTNIVIDNAQIGSAYRLLFGTAFSSASVSYASDFVSATNTTVKIPTGKLLESASFQVLVRSAEGCENVLSKTVSITVANGIFQEQLNALQTLFNATGGAEWSKKWSFVKPYQLDGVVFDRGDILSIDISYRKVKDVLPVAVFKAMPKLKLLNVEGNQLTFKSLQSFVGSPFTFRYKDQERINEEQNFITVEGSTVKMKIEIEGKNLEYQWYKDGRILPDETFSTITFNTVTVSQSGTYHATVKSKDLPELTILRKNIRMTVTSKPQTTDLAQLRDFYDKLGGKNWITPWNFDDPNLANWFGLILQNGKVISVSLVNNNLQGELPADIFTTAGFFANVENLNLSGNKLKGKLPESLKSLKNLKRLDLSGQRFENDIWTIITEIPDIEVLILTDMDMKAIDSGIGNLKKLRILFLDKNQLTEIPSILGALDRLQILNFAENDIEVLPNMFAGLKNLERLLLHKNKIRVLPKNLGLTSLFELTLSSNRLEELPEDLRSNKNLEFLDLSNNLLDFADLEKILAKQGGRTEGELKVLYVPQSRFGKYQEITLGQGSTYSIPAQTTGKGNTYWWYQDGTVVRKLPAPFEGNYDISSLSKIDAGTYYVAVTNPIAPDLILYSHETKIIVTCATQTNAKLVLTGNPEFCEGEKVDRIMTIEDLPAGNTVQWFSDGLRLSGETNLRLTRKEAGIYKVLITDSEGCSNFINQEIRLEQLPTPKPEIVVDENDLALLKVKNAEKYITFQWYFDFEPIIDKDSSSISNRWKAQKLGKYQVLVTDRKGCQGSSNIYTITATSTEQDFENEQIRIYPNPVNDILQIEIPQRVNKNYQISLWNAQGKEVFEAENTKLLNISHLPAGLYMLKIRFEGKELWKKVQISR